MLLTSPLSSPLKNPVRDVFSPAGSSQSLTAQVQSIVAAGGVGGMWDMGDASTLFQDAAGATPVTAVTQPIGRVNDKSGLGNNATQSTAGSRPLFSGPAFARFDGVDDSLAISTITLGANMDCFVAVRRNAAAKFMIGSGTTSGAKWFAVVESGSAGAADDSVGIIATYTVDGAPINGGLPLVTRGQLEAALPISGWHVIEVRNLKLSTWSSLYFSGFSGFPLNGDIGGIVLCTAQSTGNRNLIRTYLGAKVGLTL